MPRLKPETLARRRKALIAAAIDVLARRPGASMIEIAREAAIGRATLYRHFPTREALVRALSIEALDRTDAAVADIGSAPTYAEMVRRMLDAVIPLGAEFHFLTREGEGYRDPEVMRRLEGQLEQTRQMVEWGRSTGEIAPDMPTEWVVSFIDGLIWSGWTAVAGGQVPPEQVASLAFRTLWRGIGAGPEENT